MPKKAKVFLAEDHESIRKMEKMLLADQGHTVEIEATSLEEALACVKLAKEKGINVAVLDGSLSKGPWKADGKVIAEALRKEILGIKIVSCSFLNQTWGDVNLIKENLEKLGDTVTVL
jgi:CheY-like chemotaxis protein